MGSGSGVRGPRASELHHRHGIARLTLTLALALALTLALTLTLTLTLALTSELDHGHGIARYVVGEAWCVVARQERGAHLVRVMVRVTVRVRVKN